MTSLFELSLQTVTRNPFTSYTLSLRGSEATAAIPFIRTTDKQYLLLLHAVIAEKPARRNFSCPIRPSLRSCLFPATSFLPISPSLRESNAKRYERGNPIHKNDRQTISLASTRCHCRKTRPPQFLLSYTPFIAKLSVSRNFFSSYTLSLRGSEATAAIPRNRTATNYSDRPIPECNVTLPAAARRCHSERSRGIFQRAATDKKYTSYYILNL